MSNFDEWYFDAKQHNTDGFTNRDFFEAGEQSKQAEIDKLKKMVDRSLKILQSDAVGFTGLIQNCNEAENILRGGESD